MNNLSTRQKWGRIKLEPSVLRKLMQCENARPMRNMMIWLSLMGLCASLTVMLRGSWLAIVPLYGCSLLYSTGEQSREHETDHDTAFKAKH